MTMLEDMLEWIEKHPVVGAAILASIYSIVKIVSKQFTKPSLTVNSVFWSFGKKYRISAVLKFTPSENSSGYTQEQYSRPDMWNQIIEVHSKFWGCRHKVVPKDPMDVLVVNISRDGKEVEKMMRFNR